MCETLEKNYLKIKKVISEEGIFTFFRKALKYISRKILKIEVMLVFELKLDGEPLKIVSKIPITTRFANKEDIDSINSEDYGFYRGDKRYLEERMKHGDKCLLSIWENKIVGYGWIMKDEMELSQYTHIPLPEKKVYTYKGYVLKEFRGKRVIGINDMEKIRYFIKEKKEYWLTSIERKNTASIKARKRLGFREIGKIIQIDFLGFHYDYISRNELNLLQLDGSSR